VAHIENPEFYKGRGAQVNTHNKFLQREYVAEHIEGIDEALLEDSKTQIFEEHSKNIVSKSTSPDIPTLYSINPYQGCEHGCLYCYARNSHEYYGFSAGLDFERKIMVKRNAPQLLETFFNKKNYQPQTILLSGNTDCYQPIERKLKITRSLLEVFLKYRHPVSIISKNTLMERDLDLLSELAALDLVHISMTITTQSENIRRKLEPRTVTAKSKFQLMEKLAKVNIPVRLMMAPIIPGLTDSEIPEMIKTAANAGASDAAFTIVRLNGAIAEVFIDWVQKAYPDRADKILHAIADCHGGKLNDSRWGLRMAGEGKVAQSIHQLFSITKKRFMANSTMRPYNFEHFGPINGKQLNLF
jgi:DNA repair photolyase